ncbi:MAG: hypothetical protein WC752_04745 [Patescibacteria group bacterium]|jgi:hypothetical protein
MKKYLSSALLIIFFYFPIISYGDDVSDFIHFDGAAADDGAGFSVETIDYNNDGYQDIALGVIYEGTDTIGAVYLIYGDETPFTDISLADADVKISGEGGGANDDYWGKRVTNAGDVDGDGIDDLLFGAERGDSGGFINNGTAYLLYGGQTLSSNINASDIGVAIAGAQFYGSATGDQSCSRMSAGDFNNDGYNDLLLSGIYYSVGLYQRGAVYIIYGGSARFSGSNSLANVGGSIAGIIFTGTAAGDKLGKAIEFVGDVDNDGYDDVAFGATNAHYGGIADVGITYLIYGGQSLASPADIADVGGTIAGAQFYGETLNDMSANDLSGGYFNEDDYGDFNIFALQADYSGNTDVGFGYLIYGQAVRYSGVYALSDVGGSINGIKFIGEGAGDKAGNWFTAADINNDGYNEYFVTALKYDSGGTADDDYGAVYMIYRDQTITSPVLLSDIGTTINGVKYIGERVGDYFGSDAERAGDLNGDGYEEVLFGAWTADTDTLSNAGKAYLAYFYMDNDLDGVPGTDGVFDGTDCNDNDAAISANQTYYQDSDGDGLGNFLIANSVCSLTPPVAYVTNSNDTNDTIKDISTVTAGSNGDITITYVNNETAVIDIFNYIGSGNITLQQYQDNYYLALHPKAKSLALIDINALTVLSKKKLAKNNFKFKSLKIFILRDKKWAVVTAKNKKGKVKLSLVRIKINEETLGKKVQVSLINKKIKPAKTKRNKNTVLFRNKNNKIMAKYLLTKKYKLKEI